MPRMQIPFHRRRGSPRYRILTLEEQSLPWHLTGDAGRPSAAGAQLSRTEQPVRFSNSRGVRWLVKRGTRTDLSTNLRVALLCGPRFVPAAAGAQPWERVPVPFNRSRSYNRCKNITQPLIDHRGPADVQQWRESSRSVWPLSPVKDR